MFNGSRSFMALDKLWRTFYFMGVYTNLVRFSSLWTFANWRTLHHGFIIGW